MTFLAQLRIQDDLIRSVEATSRRLEQKEKECQRYKAKMEKIEALIEELE